MKTTLFISSGIALTSAQTITCPVPNATYCNGQNGVVTSLYACRGGVSTLITCATGTVCIQSSNSAGDAVCGVVQPPTSPSASASAAPSSASRSASYPPVSVSISGSAIHPPPSSYPPHPSTSEEPCEETSAPPPPPPSSTPCEETSTVAKPTFVLPHPPLSTGSGSGAIHGNATTKATTLSVTYTPKASSSATVTFSPGVVQSNDAVAAGKGAWSMGLLAACVLAGGSNLL